MCRPSLIHSTCDYARAKLSQFTLTSQCTLLVQSPLVCIVVRMYKPTFYVHRKEDRIHVDKGSNDIFDFYRELRNIVITVGCDACGSFTGARENIGKANGGWRGHVGSGIRRSWFHEGREWLSVMTTHPRASLNCKDGLEP